MKTDPTIGWLEWVFTVNQYSNWKMSSINSNILYDIIGKLRQEWENGTTAKRAYELYVRDVV